MTKPSYEERRITKHSGSPQIADSASGDKSSKTAKETRLKKRTWCYVQRPKDYEVAGCACGNHDPDWSEYKDRVWCAKCKIDFEPEHWGILDGPVPVHASELLGIYFDRINLKTNKLMKDWEGKSHYRLQPKKRQRIKTKSARRTKV